MARSMWRGAIQFGLVTIPVAIYIICLVPDWTIRFVLWLWSHTFYRLRVYGREHIPQRGGGLIVCNHVSFVDGILIWPEDPWPLFWVTPYDSFAAFDAALRSSRVFDTPRSSGAWHRGAGRSSSVSWRGSSGRSPCG